ncbi:MAG: hypothetical protein KJO29_00225 [Bacteroidia bacterium]|nr:hypothetical protein [Bacteroidia bacterium]
MRNKFALISSFLIATCFLQDLKAQVYSGMPDSIQRKPVVKANTDISYFRLSDRNRKLEVTDTLFDDFEKYNPARAFNNGSLTLGNLGSASMPIRYSPRESITTDAGFHQYDIYKMNLDEFRFYNLNRPFNDLFFSPLAGQRNFLVKGHFTRDFDKEVNVSLDYKRFNQEGFYNNQKTKSTGFGIGIYKKFPEKNRSMFICFLANNHNEEINGGVSTKEFFGNDIYRLRTAIPVRLDGDTTRHQNFSYSIDNFFDKIGEKYRGHHRLQIENGYYRYGDHDSDSADDQFVYQDYLTDTRGVRFYLGFTRIRNVFDFSFRSKSVDVKLGLLHNYQKYDNNISSRSIHDLVAFGNIGLKLKEISSFNGHAALGLGSNVGNFKLEGELVINPASQLKLTGNILAQRYDPTILQEEVYITNQLVYSNDFGKINEFVLGAKLDWQIMNTHIEFNSGIIENAIAFDQTALPYQSSDNIEYIQLIFSHKLKWKILGLENSIMIQEFSDNIFNLPGIYSVHKGYVQFPIFKKRLLTQLGLVFYNIQMNEGLRFMPATGIFYQGDEAIEYFPYSEFFGNFKIDQFRLFFKIDNFSDLLLRKEHYQIIDYPQFDYKIRFGVRWQIFD